MDEERRKETHVHWVPCLCSAGASGVAAGMGQDRGSWSSGWSHAMQRSPERMVWMKEERCVLRSGSGPPWRVIAGGTPARSQRKEIGPSLEGQRRGVSAVESYSELREWVDLGGTLLKYSMYWQAHTFQLYSLNGFLLLDYFTSSTGFPRTSAASVLPLVVTHNSKGNTLLLSDTLVCCACLLEPYTK